MPKDEDVIRDPSDEEAQEVEEEQLEPLGSATQEAEEEEGKEEDEGIIDPSTLEAEEALEAEAEGVEPTRAPDEGPSPQEKVEPQARVVGGVELSPRLRQAARRAEMSDEELSALGGRAGAILGKLADGYDRVSQELGRMGQAQADTNLQQVRQVQQPQAPVQPQPQAAAFPTLDPELVGQETVDALNALKARVEAAEAAQQDLSQWRQQQQSSYEQRRAQEIADRADAWFNSPQVQADFGGTFGQGKTRELMPGSPEHRARERVCVGAQPIYLGSLQVGQPMEVEEVLNRSALWELKNEYSQVAQARMAEGVKKRASQAIHKPTYRASRRKYRRPEDAAVRAVAERAAELGHAFDQ